MALSIHEAASIIGAPARGFAFKSSAPFEHEEACPAGCTWEFDYSYNSEPEEMPEVLITAVRLKTHAGPEYEIKVADLDGRWIAEIEALIADEIVFSDECDSLSRED